MELIANKTIQLLSKIKNVNIPVGTTFTKFFVSDDLFDLGKKMYSVTYKDKVYVISDEHFAVIEPEDETMFIEAIKHVNENTYANTIKLLRNLLNEDLTDWNREALNKENLSLCIGLIEEFKS